MFFINVYVKLMYNVYYRQSIHTMRCCCIYTVYVTVHMYYIYKSSWVPTILVRVRHFLDSVFIAKYAYKSTTIMVCMSQSPNTVDPHLSGLHLSGGSDYPDTIFPGIAICTLAIWP